LVGCQVDACALLPRAKVTQTAALVKKLKTEDMRIAKLLDF